MRIAGGVLLLFFLCYVFGRGVYELPGKKMKASNAAADYMENRYGIEISVISVNYINRIDQGMAIDQYVVTASPVAYPSLVFEVRIDPNSFSPVEGSYGFPSSDNYVPRWFQNELEETLRRKVIPLWDGNVQLEVHLFRPFQKIEGKLGPLNLSVLSKSVDYEIRVKTGLTPQTAIVNNEADRINTLVNLLNEIGLDIWCVDVYYETDEGSIINFSISSTDAISDMVIHDALLTLFSRFG